MARLPLPQIFLKIFSSSPLLDGLSDLTDPFYVPSKSIKNRKREVLLHDSLWLINMTASLSFLFGCLFHISFNQDHLSVVVKFLISTS